MSIDKPVSSGRQYYVDALRVFAVIMLIVFHTGMIFNPYDFHIKNSEISRAVGVFINTPIYSWHMPLFMLLAGASTWFALSKRSTGSYLNERVKRILIPLLFGIAVVIPPQTYVERVFNGDFTGNFFQFYPTFWTTGLYPQGNFTYNHLWFLAFLFVFAVLTAPLFVFLKSERGEDVLHTLTRTLRNPVALLLLPTITIALFDLWLRPLFPTTRVVINDWANFVYYLQFFIYGFVLISSERILKRIDQIWGLALVGALVVTGFNLYFDWTLRYPNWGGRLRTQEIFQVFSIFCTWCWLIAMIGFGRRFLNRQSAFLRYSSEIAYPYYILHQTVILLIAFYIVPLEWSVAAKFLFIGFTAFFGTALLCEVVKLWNITRFCFGMKPKPNAPSSDILTLKPQSQR